MAVLTGITSPTTTGMLLLSRNPLKGYEYPKEKAPRRVVMTDEESQALLKVSRDVEWRFHVALVLAHETGHRIGSIRQLRWSDVDLEGEVIRWRAETEKTRYPHETPMTDAAKAALVLASGKNPSIGNMPVLPAPQNAADSVGRYRMRDWWKRAESKADLEAEERTWLALTSSQVRPISMRSP